ncbi:MAG: hypothetical protein PHO76_06855 [Methylotenera sp.]|nr:hypothetical protein [Methylotenera sp.]MDD4926394.1 hypothetical protein [Methylotenera sp.]
MTTDVTDKKKPSPFRWAIVVIVVLVFVGARQLHPGGIRGLLEDSITSTQTKPEVQTLRDKMLITLKPIGAALLCLKESSDSAELRNAVQNYNHRNDLAMKELVASIKAAGGMSKSEKDLLDRQATREARNFVDKGSEMNHICSGLAERFNSGEFDLN